MTGCLMVGASLITLATPDSTLEWQNLVERIRWRESWRVDATGLRLTEAAVQGSGAGMEPGEDARRRNGWRIWEPESTAQAQLVLATSGMTGDGWHVCGGSLCHPIAETGTPVVLRPCSETEWTIGSAP